ncbi:MAG: hypothetical protein MHM6MM_004451 [Cercozoa sp. M6MM]
MSRNVQIGRIVCVGFGEDYGKLAAIVDVIDHNRVLIDGPVDVTGMTRQSFPLKRLLMTNLKIKIGRGARAKTIKKALAKEEIVAKFEKTSFAKKLAKQATRANLTDFERFKLMLAKQQKRDFVRKQVKALRK